MVTGSQGYIGSVLTGFLVDSGHQVVERDLGLYHRCRYPEGDFDLRPWDARQATPAHFEGVDEVVHLAALSNDPLGDLDPSVTVAINHDGTVRTAEAAKAAGVSRFVFASSCSLYGASGDTPLDEAAPMSPLTTYAETKVTSEAALAEMADDDFSPVFLRNATVYGPSSALRLDIVVNDLCATAAATGRIVLRSDGSAWRPQIHVTDVARAIVAVLEAPVEAVHSQALNVGRRDDNLRVVEIAELISDATNGEARIEFVEGASRDTRSYRVDFGKIESLVPAFRPKWTVAEGVRELLEDFQASGLTEVDFTRYRRLSEIGRLKAEGRLGEHLTWL